MRMEPCGWSHTFGAVWLGHPNWCDVAGAVRRGTERVEPCECGGAVPAGQNGKSFLTITFPPHSPRRLFVWGIFFDPRSTVSANRGIKSPSPSSFFPANTISTGWRLKRLPFRSRPPSGCGAHFKTSGCRLRGAVRCCRSAPRNLLPLSRSSTGLFLLAAEQYFCAA